MGLQKRTDKSRREKLALIEEIAKQPCKITTYISWPRQGRRKGFTVEEGRLWHILGTRYHYQEDLFGNKEVAGISFIVRAGLWAKYFLNEEGEPDQALSSRRSVLSKSLLESVMSIWQHREGAARLMVWLLFKMQTHKQQALSAQTLMEVAYGPKKVEDAKSDLQLRKKLANTWDEDIFTLHDRGWKLKFDSETYPVEIQPIGFGRDDSRRPRGFFEKLLRAYLWVSHPDTWIAQQLPGANDRNLEAKTSQVIKEEVAVATAPPATATYPLSLLSSDGSNPLQGNDLNLLESAIAGQVVRNEEAPKPWRQLKLDLKARRSWQKQEARSQKEAYLHSKARQEHQSYRDKMAAYLQSGDPILMREGWQWLSRQQDVALEMWLLQEDGKGVSMDSWLETSLAKDSDILKKDVR